MDSRTPKYLQVVNLILEDIEKGKLKIGDRIPSINETSFDFLLSRDTVEKAYNELRDRGIISSVRGKGFYISSTNMGHKSKVLLLFNKLSSYKKIIYYSIIETLGSQASVDLQIHHYNRNLLEDLLETNLGNYNYNNLQSNLGSLRQIINPLGWIVNGSANYLETGFTNNQ